MSNVVVRGFASNKTHVVDLPSEAVQPLTVLGHECLGRVDSWIAHCATEVGRGRGFVIMQPGTHVVCAQCRRLTGISEQPQGTAVRPA